MKTNPLCAALCAASTIIALSLPVASARAQDQTTTVTTKTVTRKPDGSSVINVTVNKESVNFAETARPVMLSGRVMVPLRGVVERLGGNVLYDAKSKVVTGAHEGTSNQFRLRVGKPEALLNGKQMDLDAPPRVIAGVTYVPLRFVSEAMGAEVTWDKTRNTVVIEAGDRQAEVKTGP